MAGVIRLESQEQLVVRLWSADPAPGLQVQALGLCELLQPDGNLGSCHHQPDGSCPVHRPGPLCCKIHSCGGCDFFSLSAHDDMSGHIWIRMPQALLRSVCCLSQMEPVCPGSFSSFSSYFSFSSSSASSSSFSSSYKAVKPKLMYLPQPEQTKSNILQKIIWVMLCLATILF